MSLVNAMLVQEERVDANTMVHLYTKAVLLLVVLSGSARSEIQQFGENVCDPSLMDDRMANNTGEPSPRCFRQLSRGKEVGETVAHICAKVGGGLG